MRQAIRDIVEEDYVAWQRIQHGDNDSPDLASMCNCSTESTVTLVMKEPLFGLEVCPIANFTGVKLTTRHDYRVLDPNNVSLCRGIELTSFRKSPSRKFGVSWVTR